MAGTHIRIELDDRQVRQALDRLLRATRDLSDPMAEIAEVLLENTQKRFERGQAPDGTPWAPLSPKYRRSRRKRRSRGADAILVLDDHLRGELHATSGRDWAEVGSSRIYAATHQFGDPRRNIPARPFLGLDDQDLANIHEILAEYLENATRR